MCPTIVRRETPAITDKLEGLHPLLRRIYLARGIADATQIERDLKKLLPFNSLMGIDDAVQRLCSALQNREQIMIVGDFDADGATSTAVAVSCLRQFGAEKVGYLVPNRFDFGYGLTPEIVDVAASQQPDLIITVDNGISSVAGVARANELGMDVIVTDHHLPGDELPAAAAIVNPNQHGDQFPSKHLAGVGVIFYLMLALRAKLRHIDWFAKQHIAEFNMANLLDLVALGTVADVVKLDENNRVLVHQGLQRMRAGKVRPGIRALLEIAGRDLSYIHAGDLGFAAGPRLNAAGRLDDMSLGINCLLCDDEKEARMMAAELDQLNTERRAIENDMQQQALVALKSIQLDGDLPFGLCLYDQNWHQGVVGLLASRIKERVHRPVIAFAKNNDTELKGSARSIPGVHIRDVLDVIAKQYPDLISKFGGHAMAAGLSLPIKSFDAFRQAFDAVLSKQLKAEDLQAIIQSDGDLTADDLSLSTAELVRDAGPWGQGFPEPVFDNDFILLDQRIVGGKHLKMVLGKEDSDTSVDAIAFNVNVDKWPNHRCEKIHAAYRLDVNHYQGRRDVQLVVEHFEEA